MSKLYCYVDETGAETAGKFFAVATIVFSSSKEEMAAICQEYEQISDKGRNKWGRADRKKRLTYMTYITSNPRFLGILRYATFRNTQKYKYDDATIDTIARGLQWQAPRDYKALVYIDALSKTKKHEYGPQLRRMGIPLEQIRGIAKDENDSLIRLADAVAGFIRDVLYDEKADAQLVKLFEKANEAGYLIGL